MRDRKPFWFYLTGKEITAGVMLPPGYGIGWRLWSHDAAICFPIPFNFIFGWGRTFWLRMRQGPNERMLTNLYKDAFELGRTSGLLQAKFRKEQLEAAAYQRGWDAALAAVKAEVDRVRRDYEEEANDPPVGSA